MWTDPSHIDTSIDSRAITFENPTGERGAGGSAAHGRKGAPAKVLEAGERCALADIEGPGVIRHIWMTFPPAPPEVMRGLVLEVFYDGRTEPSISVPCVDFFGLPHGRTAPYASMLTTCQEGRGFNAFFPMAFGKRVRVEVINATGRTRLFFFQIDYTLQSTEPSYLHASLRRENPTTLRRDFVISEGLRGPGRFLGCVVGVRTIDRGIWYGEGEVKVYRDGDTTNPTICGTGLEDYVGSAWGLGPHHAPFAGSPIDIRREGAPMPDFVGFYRWHVPDPIVFADDLRVTIQQIGYAMHNDAESFELAKDSAAGHGWRVDPRPGVVAEGIAERVDDYCATDFVYCREPQSVQTVDVEEVISDIHRRDYESPDPLESFIT